MTTKDGKKAYEEWHWGIEPAQTIDWKDADLPEHLVECGRLVEIHYRPLDELTGNPSEKDSIIELTGKDKKGSHLAFDPNHKNQRLYFLLAPSVQKQIKNRLYKKNPSYPAVSLQEASGWAGGRHAGKDYPKVLINPLGLMTNVVYATHKQGDGPSSYIHTLGEESGVRPILGVDDIGRLWFAGGNYTSPNPGITD
jgi:hypothetical protein